MTEDHYEDVVKLDTSQPIWDNFFIVHPLVVIGTREPEGEYDLAPKHMAFPIGWQNRFGFVCTPRHRTYLNAKKERAFSVSFPRPSQVVEASLTASPRCEDDSKPSLAALPTFPARKINCMFLDNSYLYFECKLDRIIDGFGDNSIIAGTIIAAYVGKDQLRSADRDDSDILYKSPLLAYLSPRRFSYVHDTKAFPFPNQFKR